MPLLLTFFITSSNPPSFDMSSSPSPPHPSLPSDWENNKNQVDSGDRWRFGWKGRRSNGCHNARQRSERTNGRKGFRRRGAKRGEGGAEVEMWSEVVERRPRGLEPLIDCSRLAEALLCLSLQTHTHAQIILIVFNFISSLIFNPYNLNLYH